MLICQEKLVEKKQWLLWMDWKHGKYVVALVFLYIYKAEAFFAYFLNALAIFSWWALLPKDLQKDQKVHGCRLCTTFG